MLPSDDDESETGGGPPPDPSTREWRHPSEIAAAAAAAARPWPTSGAPDGTATPATKAVIANPGRRLTVPLLAAGGTTVAVVALVGLALYFATGDRAPSTSVAASQPGSRSPVASTRSAAVIPDPGSGLASGETTSADEASESDDEIKRKHNRSTSTTLAPPGARALDDETGAEAESTLTEAEDPGDEQPDGNPSTTDDEEGAGIATTEGEAAPTDGPPAIGELIDPARRPADPADIDGVFGEIDGALVRLGGYVEVEGLHLTSASIIAGHQRVAVYHNGGWAEAAVAGHDDLSGVAVLVVDHVDPESPTEAHSVTVAAPAIAGADVYLGLVRAGEELVVEGSVIGLDGRTKTRAGRKVYDVVRTTLSRHDQGVGSALHDAETDAVIGIVVDSAAALTMAIPIERALTIGHSLSAGGGPADQRLGLAGIDWVGGGLIVTEIELDGPADQAGIAVDDLIVSFDDVEIESFDHLVHLIRTREVGAPITLDVLRRDRPLTIEATIGSSAG